MFDGFLITIKSDQLPVGRKKFLEGRCVAAKTYRAVQIDTVRADTEVGENSIEKYRDMLVCAAPSRFHLLKDHFI
jgi:hypothetical protein